MTTADDVIAALNRRHLLKTGHRVLPGQVPAGWRQWFADIQPDDGLVARTEAWVEVLAQHLTYASVADARLGRPFFHLQQLSRPVDPRHERGLRVGAGALDIGLHLLMGVFLLWLMYLHFVAVAPKQDADEAVQVRFIGQGNADAGGGAKAEPARSPQVPPPTLVKAVSESAPQRPQARPAAASASIAQAIMQTTQPLPASVQAPKLTQQPAPQLPVPLPLTEQPLQVSQTAQPTLEAFVLPPTRKLALQLPQANLQDARPQQQVEPLETLQPLQVRRLQAPVQIAQLRTATARQQVQQIATLTPQVLRTLQPELRPATPQPAQLQTQVQSLEVFTAKQVVTAASAPVLPISPVQLPNLREQVRALPVKSAPAAVVPVAKAAVAGTSLSTPVAAKTGQGLLADGQHAGAAAKPAPGGWRSTAKSDDWGAAKRNVAGSAAKDAAGDQAGKGVFNADGSVRLPDAWSEQSGLDLDRAGTWLERPGMEYKATRFEKYWIPSGSLLEEWVRKGVKRLAIPIPGTHLKLECVISLLQLGGGCLPVNPDVNEQPSSGRPAPNIPFKPELQEDNGSVRPAPKQH